MAAAIGVRAAGAGCGGQHDHRHRRRHDGGRAHFAFRHRLQPQRARRGRRTRRGDHQVHEARLQLDDRRAHRGGYQDQDRLRLPDGEGNDHGSEGPRPRRRPARRRSPSPRRKCARRSLEPISTIVDSVRITLERCPPELSADLVDRGLVLAGGGALLRGLDKLLQEETGLPVHVAEDPLSAVAEGTGRALQELRFLKAVASRDRSSSSH